MPPLKFLPVLRRLCYDEHAVGSEYNLHKMPPDESLQNYFANQVGSFYLRLLNKDLRLTPLEDQPKTPLLAVCPCEIATAQFPKAGVVPATATWCTRHTKLKQSSVLLARRPMQSGRLQFEEPKGIGTWWAVALVKSSLVPAPMGRTTSKPSSSPG